MKRRREQKAAFVRFGGSHLHHRTNNPCLTPLFISLHPFKGPGEEGNEEGPQKPGGNGNICSAGETGIVRSRFNLQSVISRPHQQPRDLFKRLNNAVPRGDSDRITSNVRLFQRGQSMRGRN